MYGYYKINIYIAVHRSMKVMKQQHAVYDRW